MSGTHPSVHEVKTMDHATNTFDGQKADLFINTNTLGGKTFLVRITRPDGHPTLIAIHL